MLDPLPLGHWGPRASSRVKWVRNTLGVGYPYVTDVPKERRFTFRVKEEPDVTHSVFAAAVLVNLYVDDVLRIMRRIETGCSV